VIDSIDLLFVENLFDLAIESFGRLEVVPKWLLDDHAPPMAGVFARQRGLSQLLNDGGEKLGGGRQVKEIVASGVVFAVQIGQAVDKGGISAGVDKVYSLVIKPLGEPLQGFRTTILWLNESGHLFAELFQIQVVNGNTEHGEIFGKQLSFRQIEKRRH